jgi:hypothetical protein
MTKRTILLAAALVGHASLGHGRIQCSDVAQPKEPWVWNLVDFVFEDITAEPGAPKMGRVMLNAIFPQTETNITCSAEGPEYHPGGENPDNWWWRGIAGYRSTHNDPWIQCVDANPRPFVNTTFHGSWSAGRFRIDLDHSFMCDRGPDADPRLP